MNKIRKNIAKRVRKERISAKLTQLKFAKRVRLSERQIWLIESKGGCLTLENTLKLAKYFKISIEELANLKAKKK